MKTTTKLCVYAICKNESKFIDRWLTSLKGEADSVVVLDTGSTDDSVEKLKKYEPFVKVFQYDYLSETGYFRFDKARNDSLKLVPIDTDICVVLDLDQVPRKGWSEIIKNRFTEGYNEVYGPIIDHDNDGNELNSWVSRNVHKNDPRYIWTRIIHEGIDYFGDEDDIVKVFDKDFIIDHYPDNNKDRTLYRKLLEDACDLYPEDPYYGIYYGIELSRRYSRDEAAEAFRRCLDECDFTDNDDIYYQCLINLALFTDDDDEAIDALTKAQKSSAKPTRRLYVLFADIYEKKGMIDNAINSLKESLSVQLCSNDWRDDEAYFNGYVEDRLSLFYYYHKNDYLKAIEYSAKALQENPTNERMNTNLKFYYEKFQQTRGEN